MLSHQSEGADDGPLLVRGQLRRHVDGRVEVAGQHSVIEALSHQPGGADDGLTLLRGQLRRYVNVRVEVAG